MSNAPLGTIALDGRRLRNLCVHNLFMCALSHTFGGHIDNQWRRSVDYLLNSAGIRLSCLTICWPTLAARQKLVSDSGQRQSQEQLLQPTIACSVSLCWVSAFQLRRKHWYGWALEASISEAWFRRSPRNGKPLFNMILALPELGYKEAKHSF